MAEAAAAVELTVGHGACPHDCPDACAMLVTVEDGKVAGRRGDPGHPFTWGGLCVEVNGSDRHAYQRERLLHPARVEPKARGQFRVDHLGSPARPITTICVFGATTPEADERLAS